MLDGKGDYLLLIRLSTAREITVGRLGTINFKPGGYVYVGSALGGLKNRIERHLRKERKFHWHIDYLLEYAHVDNILTIVTDKSLECDLAEFLGRHFDSVPHFGSSDCKCKSHLFYSRNITELRQRAAEAVNLLSNR